VIWRVAVYMDVMEAPKRLMGNLSWEWDDANQGS
jgi:hypothetical protein